MTGILLKCNKLSVERNNKNDLSNQGRRRLVYGMLGNIGTG